MNWLLVVALSLFSTALVAVRDWSIVIGPGMAGFNALMFGAGRMKSNGFPVEWGVGRHGPGNNSFAYFAGPEEMPLEYTADVQQIDETYEFHGPDYWKWPPGR